MSDSNAPSGRRPRKDSPTLDAVCRHLERRLDASEARIVLDFAEAMLAKAPPDLLHERSVDALAHLVLASFRFLERARPDRVDVEVGNPDIETDGWYAPVTVIRTHVSDRPFILDTLREFLHAQGVAIEYIVYPLLHVERDEAGRPVAVHRKKDAGVPESLVHCEVHQVTDPERLQALRAELERRLKDVVRATTDFGAMIGQVNAVVAELAEGAGARPDQREETEEIQAFLRWLRDGGFVFLGYCGYEIGEGDGVSRLVRVTPGSGLGVLDDEEKLRFRAPMPMEALEAVQRETMERGPVLTVSKSAAEATVHRRARMDLVGVKKLGPSGEVVGEHRFAGLFTSRAYAEDAANIPILRHKLRRILEEAGVGEGSHDYKETITIFNSLPKEELFLASAEQVGHDIRTVLTSYQTADVRVALRPDPLGLGATVMVILPRDRFSGEARKELEAVLRETFGGDILNYHLAMGEGDQARLHFHVSTTASTLDAVDAEELERRAGIIIRSWADRVRDGLDRIMPADEARRLAARYGDEFSAEYQAATDPATTVEDILELEAMSAEGRSIAVSLANRGSAVAAPGEEGVTELKVILRGERLILSDFMPILENAGLRVIGVAPFDVEGPEGGAAIYAFAVQDGRAEPLDIAGRGSLLAETILAVRRGDALNDTLNALVLGAGLHWREVDVLRAYAAYAFQAGAVPSRMALPRALVRYPGIARELFELFQTRFDPSTGASTEDREAIAHDIRSAFLASLRGVSALADDRALRRLEALISGTLRTNYYRSGGRTPSARSGGVPYISFKFSCQDIEFLRQTRLRFEVWVHSARMEGIHLRGAAVARGGIRWSDRPDDFRTEVVGLVKTQVVKNAVIIPSGSKGGFIVRHPLEDPEARFADARDQYRTLVRGLLDLTDNLDAAGETVPPEGVVCFDGPDPYLVVAADKGTATFSDVANAISGEYGFWLGDAFASGGSNGYDHKKVGITARGAWECVKRHFREMGKDIQEEPFTVVGIGDMSGDVFGNGMLLSKQIRLVAAFDHRHVFIDPDPDPAATWAERSRLFALGRSSWADYDAGLLSRGGMIVPRASKEVELTPEARAALGMDAAAPAVLDGESLIRAVLRAPAELLWNGGIGTYVKSPAETHADAGDPSNDAVRVNADELRCQVVGEGGNLGFTQRARIEFAVSGGRVNTDALDNSGGVDMSDHEVNLKILLAPAVTDGRLTPEGRNQLLEELTEEVADLVLENNRTQSLGVSLDALRLRDGADRFRDLMISLEKSGELSRASEGLPSTDVMMERVERSGPALVRPELCVLLAHAKLSLKTCLRRGTLVDDAFTRDYLGRYFPLRAVEAAGPDALHGHRLRREIVAGQIANGLVDLMGATFVDQLRRETGRSAEDVVRAWIIASSLSGHRGVLAAMARQQGVMDAGVAHRWLLGLARVLERTTRWVLHNVDADTAPGSVADAYAPALEALRAAFAQLVEGEDLEVFQALVEELTQVGADRPFAQELITLRFLDQILEIVRISRRASADPAQVGAVYYEASRALDLPGVRELVHAAAGGGSQWERRAAQALGEDVARVHGRLVVGALERGSLHDLTAKAQPELDRFRATMGELRAEGAGGLAGATVAVRELVALAERATAG